MRQLKLIPDASKRHFGGGLQLGKRKGRRPLSRKDPVHFTLKCRRFILPNQRLIQNELQRIARKNGVRIYGFSINHDHIHFVAKLPDRTLYYSFIRSFTGILARKLGKGLWLLLPFSRITNGKRDFENVMAYQIRNRLETARVIPKVRGRDPYRAERFEGIIFLNK